MTINASASVLTGAARARYSLIPGQDARVVIAEVMADARPVVWVAADDVRLQTLSALVAFFAPDVPVVEFPAWDCLPYDRASPSHEVTAHRLKALSAMLTLDPQKPALVLVAAPAVSQRVVPRDILVRQHIRIAAGAVVDLAVLQSFFSYNGYNRTDTVREGGEYSIRGGIIDVFPSGAPRPYRIDLFGDTAESIKEFDELTQRSGAPVPEIMLLPAAEYPLDADAIARFRAGYRDCFGVPGADDMLYTSVSEGRHYSGVEHFLPLFYDRLDTLFDYMPGARIYLDPLMDQVMTERFDHIADYYEQRVAFAQSEKDHKGNRARANVYQPLAPDRLYLSRSEWDERIGQGDVVAIHAFRDPSLDKDPPYGAMRSRDFADIRSNPKQDVFKAALDTIKDLKAQKNNRPVCIACYSAGSMDRMRTLMSDAGLDHIKVCETGADIKGISPYHVGMMILPLEHGFIADDLAVMTEQDILGDRLIRRAPKKRKADQFIQDLSALNTGDLVVHIDHGVGRFEGLETITAAGTSHDCLKLTYAGGDRLYIPAQNMELLSRFGGEGGESQLDKLGGLGWQARKARVKKDLMIMAGDLLAVAAARLLRSAEVYELPPHDASAFAAKFPYQETEDQAQSITDILSDLASGRPADRLVCGDVGFGKTEVAMRAAHTVAASGAQVAVIVPTTLLARQHYHNFVKRFDGSGIRIGQLSRMVSAAERKATRAGIVDGSVHIVIGTHALLAKDVHFAHLGLVIVDEEQHFGVKQKEQLKVLKNDVHVLTLTATPIPRTLQLSLTGVRDMSIIATPPVDRLAIRTSVMPYDPVMIRDAILRERHRGGQTFYVCPRIKDLDDVESKLRDLVPDVRVVVAHGQLSPGELEDRMSAFYDGQYDILLATNIIESGIDIQTANTMIVHRADMFGLSQLYQIRGRIGRSKTRAYAYLTYDPKMKLGADAQKRLEVIEHLDTLGAGFQLASHDMDIRGAGNLLGDSQSGHIHEVGVELYQHMLEEAVAAARVQAGTGGADQIEETWSPVINIGISTLIPESYIEDLNLRLNIYRRLSDLESRADIDSFAAELVDRFGSMPDEVQNLLDTVELKILCKAAHIDRLDAGPKGAVIGFYRDQPLYPERLLGYIQEKRGTIKLRPDHKLAAVREWTDLGHRMKGVRSLLKEIAEIANPSVAS